MQRIAELPNLGPKSQAMLEQVGLCSMEQLVALGAVQSYLTVKRHHRNASLNLLWALEGAISGRHWQEVAKHDRLHLLTQLEQTTAESDKS